MARAALSPTGRTLFSATTRRGRRRSMPSRTCRHGWNNGSRDAVSSVLRSFGTVRSLVVGAYAEASDDLHQLFDCVVESASKDQAALEADRRA
mmetsp:Transcript_23999/g.71375  ORF Transcript_23999/g.71375 Transcript_23999/m.71375 type:complete len:93 (+) Transcript_23999:133-411(+)